MNGAWDSASNDFAPDAVVLLFGVVIVLLTLERAIARACCKEQQPLENTAADLIDGSLDVDDVDDAGVLTDDTVVLGILLPPPDAVAAAAAAPELLPGDEAADHEAIVAAHDADAAAANAAALAAAINAAEADDGADADEGAFFSIVEAVLGAVESIGAVAKLLVLLGVKMVLFPLWIGVCLDLGVLPHLAGSSHAPLPTQPFTVSFVGDSYTSGHTSNSTAHVSVRKSPSVNVTHELLPGELLASYESVNMNGSDSSLANASSQKHCRSMFSGDHCAVASPVFVAALVAPALRSTTARRSIIVGPYEFSEAYNASGIKACPPDDLISSWCNTKRFASGITWCVGNCVDGEGVLFWPSGFVHSGRFANGSANGPGIVARLSAKAPLSLNTSNDVWLRASWRDGVMEGSGFARVRDRRSGDAGRSGDVYAGGWRAGRPDGAGLLLKQIGSGPVHESFLVRREESFFTRRVTRRAFLTKTSSSSNQSLVTQCHPIGFVCLDRDCNTTLDRRWVGVLANQLEGRFEFNRTWSRSCWDYGVASRGTHRDWGVDSGAQKLSEPAGWRYRATSPLQTRSMWKQKKTHQNHNYNRTMHAATVRYFERVAEKGKHLAEKLVLMEHLPLCSLLLHWFVGMAFMLVVTLAVLQLRESLHPDVLAPLIHPPHDDDEMLRLLLLEPNLVHVKRIVVSAAIYLGAVVMFAIAPLALARWGGGLPIFSTLGAALRDWVLPIRLCYDHAFAPILIPCEVVVFHYALIRALDELKFVVEDLFNGALPPLCSALGLSRFLLPTSSPAPSDDDDDDEADDGTTTALLPRTQPSFWLARCVLLVLFGWIVLVAISLVALIAPLVAGRALTVLTLRVVCPHDPFAFLLGALVLHVPLAHGLRRAAAAAAPAAVAPAAAAQAPAAAAVGAAWVEGDTAAAGGVAATLGALQRAERAAGEGAAAAAVVPAAAVAPPQLGPISRAWWHATAVTVRYTGFALRRVAGPIFLIAVGATLSYLLGLGGGLLRPLRFATSADGAFIGALLAMAAFFEGSVVDPLHWHAPPRPMAAFPLAWWKLPIPSLVINGVFCGIVAWWAQHDDEFNFDGGWGAQHDRAFVVFLAKIALASAFAGLAISLARKYDILVSQCIYFAALGAQYGHAYPTLLLHRSGWLDREVLSSVVTPVLSHGGLRAAALEVAASLDDADAGPWPLPTMLMSWGSDGFTSTLWLSLLRCGQEWALGAFVFGLLTFGGRKRDFHWALMDQRAALLLGGYLIATVAVMEAFIFERHLAQMLELVMSNPAQFIPAQNWTGVHATVVAGDEVKIMRRGGRALIAASVVVPLIVCGLIQNRTKILAKAREIHRRLRDARYIIGRRLVERVRERD